MSVKKIRVLIVEDNEDTLQLLNILAKEHQEELIVTFAKTISATEEVLASIGIDLVYLDGDLDTLGPYPMPQTMELLRKYAPKFIGRIFSCSSSEDYQEQMIAAGCVEAVPKTEIINHALEKSTALHRGYRLEENALVVTQINGNNPNIFLGKVIKKGDRTLISITDDGPYSALPLGHCTILGYETYMVQSAGDAGFNHIIDQYTRFTKPICTGLSELGASQGQLTPVQKK